MSFCLHFAWVLLLFSSCASAPHLKPSTPLDQVPSLREGLLLCNEYQMPRPSSHPIDLKPFIQCLEELNQTFSLAATDLQFQPFYKEIQKKYEIVQVLEWNPELASNYEIAIHAILRKISHGDFTYGTFTPREQEAALLLFPETASLLHVRKWPISEKAEFDPDLEKLYAGVASLHPAQTQIFDQVSRAIQPGPEQIQNEKHQKTLNALQEKVRQLHSLWRDLRIFSSISLENSIPFTRTLARYRELMADAQEQLRHLRPRALVQRPS